LKKSSLFPFYTLKKIEIIMLNQLIPFSTPLPPMLCDSIGIMSNQRFIKLTYEATKPFWTDGSFGTTFSYYGVFDPFINHPTIAINLLDNSIDLGSDDTFPTHAIILDRKENKIYLGNVETVNQLLAKYQESISEVNQLTLKQWEETLTNNPQKLGMFEFFGNINQSQQLERANLIHWLDQQITTELIDQLVSASNQGYPKAYFIILQLKQRLQQNR
jgi:hypothetical protein